jgi:hypothetical protein
MKKGVDYIPRKDLEFLAWMTALLLNLLPLLELLGIPPAFYELLQAQCNAFKAALDVVENPDKRTNVAIRAKNVARREVEKTVRQLVRQYLTPNPALTDTERERLGIPIHKTTRTPAPVATSFPDFDIDTSMIRRVTIHFYDQGKKKTKAKPEGQHGAEIRYAILSAPPTKVSNLNNSGFDTHTPFTLEFEEDERGKTLYMALRWENTRGDKGPWSRIEEAIIP